MNLQTRIFRGRLQAVRSRSPAKFALATAALESSFLLQALLSGLISLLPLVILAPFIGGPLSNDEGIFATLAREMLRGNLPYRDLFEVTPPGTYGLYALGFLVFGEQTWVPHVLLIAVLSATATLIFVEARLLFSLRIATYAALAFAASNAFVVIGSVAVDEYFVLLPLSASYVAFTLAIQGRGRGWLVAAGVFSGLAAITNQTSIFHFVFLMCISAQSVWSTSRGIPYVTLALPLAGMSLVFGAVATPYLVTWSFDDLWYGAVVYPLLYAGGSSVVDRLPGTGFALVWFALVAAPLFVLACIGAHALMRRTSSVSVVIVVGWTVVSLIGLAATGKFYHYYFAGMLPPLAMLAGIALSKPPSLTQGSPLPRIVAACVICPAIVLSFYLNAQAYVQPSAAGRLIARVSSDHQVRDAQSPQVAQYLSSRTSPDETIYNLGHHGELYFYANRRPASRFFHEFAVLENADNRRQLIRDLETNKPAYIVDTQWPQFLEGASLEYLWDVGEFIAQNYVLDKRIYFDPEWVRVYERANGRPGSGTKLTFYADIYRLRTKDGVEE